MAVADAKILNTGEEQKTIYQSPSLFIANAHNDLYAFYMENGVFEKKI